MSNDKDKLTESLGLKISISTTPRPSLSKPLPPFYQSDFNLASKYEKPNYTWKDTLRRTFSFNAKHFLFQTVPVFKWLPKYNCRRDFMYDVLSGITVAIMHIPQGMAYGMLGNVAPIVGIYMAFFPVLIYFLFGTSRHVSIGTFAIVCLMTGKAVDQYSTATVLSNGTVITHGNDPPYYTNIDIMSTITFSVSLFLFLMYFLRLGIIANLMSETLVNAFTCACACHVVSAQLKDLFGFPFPKRRGFFSFPLGLYDALLAVPVANRTAVTVSTVSIILMVINNEIIKPRLAKITKIPFPIELVAVAIGTAVSYFMNLHENYGITIVGTIPTGMPDITVPKFSLMPTLFVDTVIIAITSYAITVSMALIYANKDQYKIGGNQELLALGASDLVGSLFSCMPIAASLSRTHIQYAVGGKTQVASLVSCAILLTILLWIGPIFESLPRCVLASIIVVALKSLLVQCTKFPYFWKLSKWDGAIWLVTYCTTVFIAIDVGLAAGLLISLSSLLYRSQTPYTCVLGCVPNTDLYLDTDRYKAAMEINGIRIFHYCGTINFSTKATFKKLLYEKVNFRPKSKIVDELNDNDVLVASYVILDCSAITYIDPAGVEQLRQIMKQMSECGVTFYIAACSVPVYETLKKCDALQSNESPFRLFPRIHDAVVYAKVLLSKMNST